MASADFNQMMQAYKFSAYQVEGPQLIGGEVDCADFHRVRFFPGAENNLMPLALKSHPELLPDRDLSATYGTQSVEGMANFRRSGAVVGIPHLEDDSYPMDQLELLAPDFVEMYNLHANIKGVYEKFNPLRIGAFLLRVTGFLINPLVTTDLYFLAFLKQYLIFYVLHNSKDLQD